MKVCHARQLCASHAVGEERSGGKWASRAVISEYFKYARRGNCTDKSEERRREAFAVRGRRLIAREFMEELCRGRERSSECGVPTVGWHCLLRWALVSSPAARRGANIGVTAVKSGRIIANRR